MSTKTTFKRIALVAVAALGLGTVSVAPSSAAVLVGAATNTLATVTSSSTVTAGDTATLTFTSTWVGSVAFDSVSVAAYATSSNSPEIRLSVSDSSTSVAGSVRVVDAGSTTAEDTSAQVGVTSAAAVTVTYKLHVYAPQTAGTYNTLSMLLSMMQVLQLERHTQLHLHGHSLLLLGTQFLQLTQQLLCVLATRQQVQLHSVEPLKAQTLQQRQLQQDQSQEQLLLRQSSLFRRMLHQPLMNQ